MQDLDFDTDGDGSTYTFSGSNPVSDSGDAYHNSGSGWDPIGPAATPNSSRRRTPDVRGAYTRNCAGRRRTKIRLERQRGPRQGQPLLENSEAGHPPSKGAKNPQCRSLWLELA